MKSTLFKTMLVVALLAIVLSACGPKATEPAPTAAPAAGDPTATQAAAPAEPTATQAAAAAEPTATQAAELSGKIVWVNHRTDLDKDGTLAKYADEFKKLHPGVTVEWETMTDYDGEMQTRMGTKDYGDVLLIPGALTPDKYADFLVPLGSVEELGKKYMFINQSAYKGTVYGISITGNAGGLLYNKEVFKAAGITEMPKTPEEFQKDLGLIKEKTKAIPLYTNYHALWALTQWDSMIGAIHADADYRNIKLPHSDNPFAPGTPYYTIYKMMYDAVKAGYTEADPTTTDWEKSKTMLVNGEIGVMALGSWAVAQMQGVAVTEGKDPAVVGYMPFPYTVNGKQYATAGGDYSIAVNKNSTNQAAAIAFLFWFLDQSNYAYDQGGLPPIIGSKLPPQYQDFSNAGVIFVMDNPAKPGEEGLRDLIDKQAEIGFAVGDGSWQATIVDAARGQLAQTFDDIMNAANEKWNAARKAMGVNP